MAADIIKMKGSDGKVQYPVTSSEAVGMSDGSGNLDKTLATLEGKTVNSIMGIIGYNTGQYYLPISPDSGYELINLNSATLL